MGYRKMTLKFVLLQFLETSLLKRSGWIVDLALYVLMFATDRWP